MKKRYMTLAAGITAIALTAVYIVFAIKGLLSGIKSVSSGSFNSIMITAISLSIAGASLRKNIVSAKSFNCNHEDYNIKSKSIIFAVVLNLLMSAVIIYSIIESFNVINLIVVIGLVASSVLYVADICLEKKNCKDSIVKDNKIENTEDQKTSIIG